MASAHDPPHGGQKRKAVRVSLQPSEIPISRCWIHDADATFIDLRTGPALHALRLEQGVTLSNISASGALINIVLAPEINLPDMISLRAESGEGTWAWQPDHADYRDITLLMRLDLDKNLHEILLSSKVVRFSIAQTTAKRIHYEAAISFYLWGTLHPVLQWRSVRDDSVPLVAAWITRRQLVKGRR